jgi:hypothetical protein
MSVAFRARAVARFCAPVLVLLAIVLVAPGSAAAAEAGPLSPELSTLASPTLSGAPEAVQDEAIDLPAEGPGSLVREGERVIVEAHFEGGAMAQTGALEAAGAEVLEASGRYQTVAVAVAPEDLEALAEVPGLAAVEASREPVFYGAAEGAATAASGSESVCEGGSVISQGLTQLNVAAAREAFGARGAGETIGVISDSYDTAIEAIGGGAIASHAAEDELTDDLPGPGNDCSGQELPVHVVAEGPADSTDEGRAMLQVVHDLAPHAELAFATAYSTELQFAHNIERLAEPVSAGGGGADVIVDDVGYFAEPFYQDGPVANAIRKVTEAGVTYFTATGNDNLIESGTGNEIASWERKEFKDTACPGAIAAYVGEASSQCMNFSPSGTDNTFGITVEASASLIVDLQWAEPWYGVTADLNAYLLGPNGELIQPETVKNAGTGSGVLREPLELLGWENPNAAKAEVQLVIARCTANCNHGASASAKPRLKFDLMEDGAGVSKTEYPSSNAGAGIVVGPTIYGHAGSAAAISVAAANYTQPAGAPAEPERYSSRGPVTHYFAPVNGTTAAAALATPEVLAKPDVTATDCASTTFFASLRSDGWHFCGTSEAAPHAAAIAALMQETEPAATPATTRAAMETSATPFTTVKSHSAVGAGLLNADQAILALGGSPVFDPASTEEGPSSGGGTQGGGSGGEVTPTTTPTAPTTTPTPSPGSTGGGSGGSTSKGAGAEPLRARIVAHPKAVERTRRNGVVGRFRLAADGSGATFYCQIDGGPQRVCGASFRRRFGLGRHVVKVRAAHAGANVAAATPAVFRFRVERVRRWRGGGG